MTWRFGGGADCNTAALGQIFLYSNVSSDPLKKSRKTPRNKSPAANQLTLSPHPDKGRGNSTQAKVAEMSSSRSLQQKTAWKNRVMIRLYPTEWYNPSTKGQQYRELQVFPHDSLIIQGTILLSSFLNN